MTFRLLLLLLLTLSAAARLSAQSFLNYMNQYDHGWGLEYYTLRGTVPDLSSGENSNVAVDYIGIGPSIGFYYPFMRIDSDLSWGIQPNFVMAAGISPAQRSFQLTLSLPVNLMIKYGTDAEYYGKKPFGFGAGIGYRVAAALIEISDDDGFTGIYSTPTAVAEVSLRAGFLGLLKARFTVDLLGAAIETKGTFDLHYYGLYLTSTKNF